MEGLDELLNKLDAKVSRQHALAFELLGHIPGIGTDIRIRATTPVSETWHLEALTPCGQAFLARFYAPSLQGNRNLTAFKGHALEWGLSFETQWAQALAIKVDP